MRGEPLVLAVAMTLPTLTAWGYFVALSPQVATDPRANPLMQAAYAASKVVQFGLPVACLWLADPSALRPGRPGRRGVGFGVAFGVAVGALALALYYGVLRDLPLFLDTPARLRSKVTEFGLATPAGYLGLAAFIAVAHAALEEYYWRWFVFGRLRRYVPVPAAAGLSGLAFMGHHVLVLAVYFPGWFWAATVPLSLCIALGGVVWALLYHRSGSLLGPWVSHVLVDAAVMAIGYDLLFVRT
jgi:membrane protease YdiL (CAAX protease family)